MNKATNNILGILLIFIFACVAFTIGYCAFNLASSVVTIYGWLSFIVLPIMLVIGGAFIISFTWIDNLVDNKFKNRKKGRK